MLFAASVCLISNRYLPAFMVELFAAVMANLTNPFDEFIIVDVKFAATFDE